MCIKFGDVPSHCDILLHSAWSKEKLIVVNYTLLTFIKQSLVLTDWKKSISIFFGIAIKTLAISSHKDLEYNTNAIRFHLWNKYLNGCLIYNRKLSSWNKSMCMESVHNDLKNTCSFFCGVYIIRLNIQIRRNQFCYQYYHSEKNKKFHSNNTCIMWWAIK